MDRRDFLRSAGASVAATAIPANEAKKKPNVVFMICDDLGYGDLGCYGSKLPTPNLDRMAKDGVRFTHHNSAHPLCSASRAALMTSRYAPRSHVPGAYGPNTPKGMDLDEQTLGDLFRAAGYRTQAIGKWHLGDGAQYVPTARGFDHYFGVMVSDDMQPLPLYRDAQIVEAEANRELLTPEYTHEAVKFIEAASEPFFLYMAFSYPHDPAKASPRFAGKTKFGDFGDCVAEIDWSAGEVLNALRKKGVDRDTIVFFTSDHNSWFQGNPGNLRGRKSTTFEGGCRVPFIARWPGMIPANSTQDGWSLHLNILPTLAEWCGLAQPKLPIDGVAANDQFLMKVTETKPVPQIYFSTFGKGEPNCIRIGDWKLRVAQSTGDIYINDHSGGPKINYMLPHPELYNLRLDPCESYDVAKSNPDIVRRLRAEMDRMLETFPEDTRQKWQALQQHLADRTTPPGAAARVELGKRNPHLYEPPDRQ